MKKEQGHTGGVAVLADQETPISLLRDIKRLLSLQQATDMPADGEEYRDYAILSGAGDLYIDTDVQFGYAYIPNCPRDITIYSGTRGGLIGSFKAGAFVQFRMPRSTGVTITYGAGSAAQTLTVYLSAREVSVSPGSFLVDPGTAAGSIGKAEDAAHTSGDVGVMMLGVRNDSGTARSDADGDYTPISVSSRGIVLTSSSTASAGADAASNTLSSLNDSAGAGRWLGVASNLFNGATWDRQRNNVDGTALASAARTATTTSADIVNYNGRGIIAFLNITGVPGVETITLSIDGKDPVSGAYAQLAYSGAAAATGVPVIVLYPGVTDASGATSSPSAEHGLVLPRTFRFRVTHSASGLFTYSVGYSIIN